MVRIVVSRRVNALLHRVASCSVPTAGRRWNPPIQRARLLR